MKDAKVLRDDVLPCDVFGLLERMESGLMLDVGAGQVPLRSACCKLTRDCAQLPFSLSPGNHSFIDERIGADPRVKIVKKAVANRSGTALLHVNGIIIQGTDAWAGIEGYSSCGVLVSDSDASQKR